MRMYLISDNIDTQIGMRLAGVEGVVVHDREALVTALSETILKKDIGIILITTKLSTLAPDYIASLKLSLKQPLIVEIPDRHGKGKSADFITRYINEAIGLKI